MYCNRLPKYLIYRVHQLILIHFRGTFFHDKMTLYSKINDFRDPEIGRFDMKHYFFTSLTSHGLHDLRKKRYKIFEEMWVWGPHGYATPFSLRLKVAEYQGFHMWYTSLLYQHWFCQKLIKDRRPVCFCFHFHLNMATRNQTDNSLDFSDI